MCMRSRSSWSIFCDTPFSLGYTYWLHLLFILFMIYYLDTNLIQSTSLGQSQAWLIAQCCRKMGRAQFQEPCLFSRLLGGVYGPWNNGSYDPWPKPWWQNSWSWLASCRLTITHKNHKTMVSCLFQNCWSLIQLQAVFYRAMYYFIERCNTIIDVW